MARNWLFATGKGAQYGADSRLVNPASLHLERRVRRNDVVKKRPGLQFAPFRR